MRTQTTRTIAGRVNADGTLSGGSGFTSRKTGTGSYQITVPFRVIGATATLVSLPGLAAITVVADSTITAVTTNTTGAGVDLPFFFTAVGAT